MVQAGALARSFFTNLLLLPVLMIGARMGRSVDILLSMLLSGVGAAFLVLFSTRYMNATVEWGFTRCVYGFFVGCLVNHVYYAGHIRTYLRRPGRSLSTLLELGTVAVVVLFVATTGQSAFSYLAPLLFACVVLIFAAEAGGVSLILNMQYFQIIGMLSYSIYMVHFYLKYILQAVVLVFGRLVLELPASSIFCIVRSREPYSLWWANMDESAAAILSDSCLVSVLLHVSPGRATQ